jgi:hypothetical protein
MTEDLRSFYAEQDQVYYDLLDDQILIMVKASESGLSVDGVIAALPEVNRGSIPLVRLSLGYLVADGLLTVADEIYRVVPGKDAA